MSKQSLIEKYSAIKAKREAGEGGFTLIELLVVVVIIGILIAIAIPLYLNYQKGAKDKSAQSDLRAAVSTVNQCFTDNSNGMPAAPTGNSTESADLVFTCGTSTETANASDGTTMTYAPTNGDDASGNPVACTPSSTVKCPSFTILSFNSGGHKNSSTSAYTYDSAKGGNIG